MSDSSFLSRWSRRKAAVREGVPVPAEPAPPAVVADAVPVATGAAPEAPQVPAPTLEDVAALRPGDEIARFVARGVDESVKRAALKTLFADPHFNVMDGLDIYIDDYSKPDPIPPEILRQLRQAETLGLFEPTDEERAAAQAAAAAAGPVDVPSATPAEFAESGESADTTDIPSPVETPQQTVSQSAEQGPQDPHKCA
ncbi:hypothetical protein CNE_1c28900 [Cupriavidus necator N-1]|uniref:DUF3306 domain-containing protein n=1 Tax=Cupriavidus necator (strain ATCC 43291 / DSM 13513 / CCUG 52238 / LMG 8453 / N-1) TaxID=1042878 RepID=G0EUF6_CUPNN|nr:DUF3306 domain-containing protein [Cupriavidus necator]AEI78203.1 hypothetical protein CNE_1c28900 [Cupriavidus necator N-1]MDX6013270.1 DUF3306 domain-containing protein [Cupriavidus necator]